MNDRCSRHLLVVLRRLALALPLLALWIGAGAPAVAQEIPPAPTRWVTDTVGFLSADVRASLDTQLEGYERSSGHHLLVWIGSTVGGGAVEDFTIKTFTAWKVGRQGIDDGLVLFVFADDRKVRIEVGYGLEERVPDIVANRIIQDRILPRIRAGDRDGAITEGVAALTAAIEGKPGAEAVAPSGSPQEREQPTAEPVRQPRSLGEKIMIGLLILGILIFVITNPGLAFWLLLQILSGSGGGGGRGGGGGGGGWSGGGGRGGGGGATGSW